MIASRIKARIQGGVQIAEGVRDLIFVGGGAAIVFGIHLWSIPAAWVTGGALAMYLAFASASVSEEEPVEVEPPFVPQTAGEQRRAAL